MEYRHDIIDFILQIYSFSQHARIYGLLSLEDKLEGIRQDDFREGMTLVINGTDPAEVDSYARGFIEKSSSPDERILREISRTGLLGIQCGDHSIGVGLNCASKLGDEGRRAFLSRVIEFERRKSEYFSSLKMTHVDSELAEEFAGIVHTEFIYAPGSVIMLADPATLATALRGCQPDLQARVLQNVPMEEMNTIISRPVSEASPGEIEASMRKIVLAYRRYQ